jgi:WD40 repeat protein
LNEGLLLRDAIFSPDGRYLAVAGGDPYLTGERSVVRIWDADTGALVHDLKGHVGIVNCLAFSPDGRRLVSGASEDRAVKVWDVSSGKEALTLRGHSERVWAVAFSPDGGRIYSGAGDHSVRFWDATPLPDTIGAELHILRGHAAPVSRVAWSPDGKYVASGGLDGDVRLWDPEAGITIRTLRGHKRGSVLAVQFSPDGGRLAAVGLVDNPQSPVDLGQLKIWHVADGRELLAVRPEQLPPLFTVAFLPGGMSLALTTDAGAGFFIVDAATGDLLQASATKAAGVPSAVVRLVADPCGRYLAAGTLDGYVFVWEVPNNPDARPASALLGSLPAAQALVSLLGRMILARPRVLPAHVSRVAGLSFSGDGRYLISAGIDSALKLWDTATWQSLPDLPGHPGAVWDLAASPDGRYLASAGSDGTIHLWDLRKRTEQRALRGHTDTVSGIAFSPDGRRLASAGRDRTVRIWHVPKQ